METFTKIRAAALLAVCVLMFAFSAKAQDVIVLVGASVLKSVYV